MAKPPRDLSRSSSRTYFVTANSWNGHALIHSERVAKLFIATLLDYREQGKFQLHEFVVMPDHFHAVLTPGTNITLERAMQFIRGGFSYRAGKELGMKKEIWQRGYVDHRIRDARDYEQHREYVRMNPVKVHLVETPEAYPYGSAHPSFELDPVPPGAKAPEVSVRAHERHD
jgi:putative transposase